MKLNEMCTLFNNQHCMYGDALSIKNQRLEAFHQTPHILS
jgi:hypothetical protein